MLRLSGFSGMDATLAITPPDGSRNLMQETP
jgi:hypothetical protein